MASWLQSSDSESFTIEGNVLELRVASAYKYVSFVRLNNVWQPLHVEPLEREEAEQVACQKLHAVAEKLKLLATLRLTTPSAA